MDLPDGSPPGNNRVRDFLIGLSLANLFFLRAWERALFGLYPDDFKPEATTVAVLVLMLAVVFRLGWQLARSSDRLVVFARVCFLLLLLVPANALRLSYQTTFRYSHANRYDWVVYLILAIAPVITAWAVLTGRLKFSSLARCGIVLALVLAPFLLFTFGSTMRTTYHRLLNEERQKIALLATTTPFPAAPFADWTDPGKERPRVVWIIFDELDERAAFTQRPASVSLPELDRFRRESFVATSAYPPGSSTMQSIPALLNGREVTATTASNDLLSIWQKGQTGPVVWSAPMTIFKEAGAAGLKTGLVGAFFPYCATHGSVITSCRDFHTPKSWPTRVSSTVLTSLEAVPFAYRLFIKGRTLDRRIERYEFVIHNGSEIAADPKLNLVYLHFPFPHPPGVYDRESGHLDVSRRHSYLDNLALTDVSFGVLRRAMEEAGVWRQSVVIVSSDHWWRTDGWQNHSDWTEEEEREIAGRPLDHRIPFMVKLAGSELPRVFEHPFNTLVTRRVVMALLHGRLSTNKDLAQLLEESAK
jgi:fumarate reductase subunit D